MVTTTATRRLAAILAADVAGYSRLMGADEEGTLECLMAALSRQLYRARIESQGSPGVMPLRRHLATLR